MEKEGLRILIENLRHPIRRLKLGPYAFDGVRRKRDVIATAAFHVHNREVALREHREKLSQLPNPPIGPGPAA